MNPTIKFYNRLVAENGYELVLAEISIGQSQPITDQRFVLRDRQGRPIVRRLDLINAWLHLAYRKTTPAEFRYPSSHWKADESRDLAERIDANFAIFSRYRLTERGQPGTPPPASEDQIELRRREHQQYSLQSAGLERQQNGSHENRRKLQVYEHEHLDVLTRDLQQREHEHSDKLLAALVQGLTGSAAYLPLAAICLGSLLNGGALLMGLSHGAGTASSPFAAGLVSAFLPTATAWTDLTRNRSPIGKLARHGSRLLWILSIVLFAAGCLFAGPQ